MYMIDIRCGASLDSPTHEQGRCQLLMGHEGVHAVMFTRGGHLEVRIWRVPGGVDATDHVAACEMRPWSRGFPRAAWIETDDLAALLDISGSARTRRTRLVSLDD